MNLPNTLVCSVLVGLSPSIYASTFSPSASVPIAGQNPNIIPVTTNFDADFDAVRQTILRDFPNRGPNALTYVDARLAEAQPPRLLTRSEFNAHLCIRRNIGLNGSPIARNLNSGFSFAPCVDSNGVEVNSGTGLAEVDLLDHFFTTQVDNGQVTIDYLSWQRFRLGSFVLFHLQNDPTVFTQSNTSVFDKDITIDFFETAFRAIGGEPPQGRTTWLERKTEELFDPIDYQTVEGRSFGIQFNPLTFAPPRVVRVVACFGRCIAYDESNFVDRIGTFSYPWQILFNSDVNDNFLPGPGIVGGYASLLGGVPQWLRWVDFIAGNGEEDTLRNTLFFRENFRNVIVAGAVN